MRSTLSEQTSELVALVRERRTAAFVDRATQLPAADVADVLMELRPGERCDLVQLLPPRLAGLVLLELPRDAHPEAVLAELGSERAARLIGELDDDDAASLLARMPAAGRRALLDQLDDPAALDHLLAHDARSAGGLMTSRVVAVSELDSIALAIEAVRRQAAAMGDFTEIFVVDAERRLRGLLSVKQLLLAAPAQLVRDAMSRTTVHVDPGEDHAVVARVITRYGLASVPVVDRSGRLLGRVAAADVHDVSVDEASDDLLRFGGVSVRGTSGAGWIAGVRARLPSLYANLVPAFGAAAVVYFFKGSVARIVTLAVWMPVVGGVGGNAGTQALATSVRNLVANPDRGSRLRGSVLRETGIGLANGIGIGAVVGGVSVLLGESWKLGLVVAVAMAANLAVAAVIGAALPILLVRAGRDPALASPVLVTALTDATGFALLLGLASAILLR